MSNSGGIYLHQEQVVDRMNCCSQHGDHGLSTEGTQGHQTQNRTSKGERWRQLWTFSYRPQATL